MNQLSINNNDTVKRANPFIITGWWSSTKERNQTCLIVTNNGGIKQQSDISRQLNSAIEAGTI